MNLVTSKALAAVVEYYTTGGGKLTLDHAQATATEAAKKVAGEAADKALKRGRPAQEEEELRGGAAPEPPPERGLPSAGEPMSDPRPRTRQGFGKGDVPAG